MKKKMLKFPGFDWLAMWHCGLFYNAYLKNLQPFTRKGQGFFHPLYPQLLDPNFVVAPYLGLDTQDWFSSF